MLKNSTKLTSLVVAAATVASMTPAFATDKIADKDGTIYNAVAYKDGKFYVDGDDLDSADGKDGVYFLEGGKYKEVDDDVDSGDEVTGTYGDKYVEITNGDYYVDLSNGKVTDDFLRGDDAEDAASNLKKKIRKDDPSRYDDDAKLEQAKVDVDTTADRYNAETSSDAVKLISGLKFSDPYYVTQHYKFAEGKNKHVVGDTATVYTSKDGKYVDADNDLGKLNIIVPKKVINVDSITSATAAEFEIRSEDKKVSSSLETISFDEVNTKKAKNGVYYDVKIQHNKTLASDDKYIYRLATLVITGEDKDGNVIATPDAVYFGSTKNPVRVEADETTHGFYVIQKISKEQGDDKDDAKLPKTTQTYLFNEYKDFIAKGKDADDNAGSRKADFFFNLDTIPGEYDNVNDLEFTVADGKLTAYAPNKKEKDDKFKAVTLTFATKNGTYYCDKDDTDKDYDGDHDDFAWDTDKDGNLWVLQDGKIFKYNNKGDFGSAVYKCDGGYNELSVYDKDNLIAYNEDDDQYAIVGGKSSTGKYEIEDENKTATTTTAAAGWVQNADGTWSYNKADGTKAIGWLQSPASGLWYYMDANGIMMSNGWVQDGAYWYYLKADGAMATGWIKDKGTWYFLKKTPGNRGAMQTGWIQDGGKWYYCNASGAMLANTTVGGYKLGADGAWIK